MSGKQWVITAPDGKLKTTIPMKEMTVEEKAEAIAQLSVCETYRERMEAIYQNGGRCLVCGYTRADLSRTSP